MIDRQMLKGAVEMAILWIVEHQEPYGYALLRQMVTQFPDLQERTVYAVLRRLHENGYAETFSKEISEGPTRKYYRITDLGKEHLKEMIESWKELDHLIKSLGILNETES